MPAYFVAELGVTNPAGFELYRAAVPATIAQYGGRYLTRGGAAELIEGGPMLMKEMDRDLSEAPVIRRAGKVAVLSRINIAGALLRSRIQALTICYAPFTGRGPGS